MSRSSDDVSIIAIDTGGTFTDVVAVAGDTLRALKVASTPDDPARAVLEAIRLVCGDAQTPFLLVHGSTVATNALLEGKVARVALVTNSGFEDVIEIGRQNRPELYALYNKPRRVLVALEDRRGITGRLDENGTELQPVAASELADLANSLDGIDAVAIALLHSYANDAHEQAVATALAGRGLPMSVSSELLREFREYERTATTVVNALVAPVMDRYLGRIAAESGASHVRIMGSGGGALSIERARHAPVHTVLSGPAGGVHGALEVARAAGFEHIMTFDMGGTSTDVALCPGKLLHTREFTIDGVPVAIPVLDIHTVGAGGGSIAALDAGGVLRVGPRSAGAQPGPICYGTGGAEVTVTDANVWLGRIPVAAWPHGTLDRRAIAAPLARLAAALGCNEDDAALGIIDVVDTAMEGALRVISVERGYDPADFTLVAFGGAAGLHACALATRLGIPRVLVPPMPGVLSAYGMLVAPLRTAAARSVLRTGTAASDFELEAPWQALDEEAVAAMSAEGVMPAEMELRRSIDARYAGQSYELNVAAEGDWLERFHALHEQHYGYARRGSAVEAVTLRVQALGPPALGSTAAAWTPTAIESHSPERSRGLPCHHRGALAAAQEVSGPAIVLEYSATTWIPEGWTAEVLAHGSLLLQAAGSPG